MCSPASSAAHATARAADTVDEEIGESVKKIFIALIALFAFAVVVSTTASTSRVSARVTPLPQATPDKPLSEEEVTALIETLKGGLSDLVEDEDQVTTITEKWDARENLAGKTHKQILGLLFADVRSVVKDKETQDAVWANWNKVDTKKTEETEPEPTTPAAKPNPGAGLGQYISGLTYNPQGLLAVQATGRQPVYEKVNSRVENRQVGALKVTKCSLTTRSLSRNFTDIAILQPTRGVIYPGSLVFADRALIAGGPRALPGLARAPVNLRIDLPGADNDGRLTIDQPSEARFHSALGEALNGWNASSYQDGYVDRSRSGHASTVAYTSAQIALGLGFNEDWAQGPVSAQFKNVSGAEKNVVAVVFKRVFYTVTVDAPETPAGFFGSGVTAEEARGVFSSAKVPAYVSSVSYGRFIMLRMETDKTVRALDAEAALNYAAGLTDGAGMKANYDNILRNSEITLVTIGANGQAATENVNAAGISRMLKGTTAAYSKTNPGVPISYTVNFLKDNSVARVGATTDYSTEDCQDFPNYWILIRQNGAYMADFTVTWDEPGSQGRKEEGRYAAGNKMQVNFPGDATNIRVNLKTMSDWPILNKLLQPSDLNKCYQTGGVATGPTWDNNCRE